MHSWKPFLSRVVVGALAVGAAVGAGVFVGARMAAATPGGPTRDALTYSGVLQSPPTADTALFFQFNHRTRGNVCNVTTDPVRFAASGAFSIPVPLTACRDLFDGDDVTYQVRLSGPSGELLTPAPVDVNPVPYARFADQAGVANDCPAGYARFSDASDPGSTRFVVCRRALGGGRFDEVVKVGTGASAFWIDRYEASAWDSATTTGSQLFNNRNSTSTAFPANGQWRRTGRTATISAPPLAPVYAFSVRGVAPAVSITWFQAVEACAASGKELPTGVEWMRAVQGTEDPGENDGVDGGCRTTNGDPMWSNRARETGRGPNCRSGWGAQDMIGNVWEWTAEWYASVGQVTSAAQTTVGAAVTGIRVNDNRDVWGAGYGDDGTWNITSVVYNTAEDQIGIPSAAIRGGDWGHGTRAGAFALNLGYGPSDLSTPIGFRCVARR